MNSAGMAGKGTESGDDLCLAGVDGAGDDARATGSIGRMPGFLRGLGDDREFVKLWSGGLVSSLGFHVSILALPLTAASVLRATPFEMGVLGAAQFLPRLLFGLLAGVWVDRLRRRPVMIVADLGRALLLASVPVAFVLGTLSIPQLDVVAIGVGSFSVFFSVAAVAYVPSLVGREALVSANARMSAGEAVAQIGGPNLAGVLVQVLTAPIAIGVDAVSYVVSAASIAWIRRPEPAVPPRTERRHLLSELRDGLAAVGAIPVLRGLFLAALNIGIFTGGIRGPLIVLYLVQLGVTPIEFGFIYGVGGASALVGAVIAVPLARRIGLGRTLVSVHVVTAAFAACVPLAGLVEPDARLPVLLLGQVGLGVFAPVWGVNGGSLQQIVTPNRLLGRVGATFALVGVNPAAAVLAGVIATAIGLQLTLAIAAVGAACTALVLLASPVANLRTMPEPAISAGPPG